MAFTNPWVVTVQEKELFDQIFEQLDTDNDGYIIGTDESVRKIFLKTALVHTVLAHIWNLSDILQNGKLNSEQFALAMYLVNEAKKGIELPSALTPEMIPPSLRPKSAIQKQDSTQFNEANKFSNKELELLAEELKVLENEKHNLEHEVTHQETQMKLKESEIKSIKNEIETMLQMIKQLENQKVEASKRLDEMENQTVTLKQQSEEQLTKNEIEEAELKVKKEEFEGLKSEEQQFETKVNALKKEIEAMSSEIAESQLLVCKYKTKTIDLEEYEKHLNEEIKEFDICIASKDVHRLNALIAKQLQPPEGVISLKPDTFNDGEFPNFSNQFAADPFAGEDPFANESNSKQDLFANDAFASAFGGKSNSDDFNDDPFSARNESTPELPPKKTKGPPPRPAPPKSSKPQPKSAVDPWANASNDPFSSASNQQTNNSGFANFDDFANFDQAFVSSTDPFAPINKSLTNNNNFDFDPFANFNSNNSKLDNKFDKFETNWTSDDFDPFAPPTNKFKMDSFQFSDLDDDKKRKDKQIKDDYELALRLSQSGSNSNYNRRKF